MNNDIVFYKKGGRIIKKKKVIKIKAKNINSKNVSQKQIVNIIHPVRRTNTRKQNIPTKKEDRIIYVPTSNGGLSQGHVEHLMNRFKPTQQIPLSIEQLRDARLKNLEPVNPVNPVEDNKNNNALSGISSKPPQDNRPDILETPKNEEKEQEVKEEPSAENGEILSYDTEDPYNVFTKIKDDIKKGIITPSRSNKNKNKIVDDILNADGFSKVFTPKGLNKFNKDILYHFLNEYKDYKRPEGQVKKGRKKNKKD